MTQLYKLTGELLALQGMKDMPPEAIADTFEALEGEFNDKAYGLMMVVRNIDTTPLTDEIARLQGMVKAAKSRQESLKEYLRTNMEASGIKKIECPLFTITCAAGRDVVQIDDIDKIPDKFMVVRTEVSADKRRLLSELKDGEEIPGVSMGKSKSSIRIK